MQWMAKHFVLTIRVTADTGDTGTSHNDPVVWSLGSTFLITLNRKNDELMP